MTALILENYCYHPISITFGVWSMLEKLEPLHYIAETYFMTEKNRLGNTRFKKQHKDTNKAEEKEMNKENNDRGR